MTEGDFGQDDYQLKHELKRSGRRDVYHEYGLQLDVNVRSNEIYDDSMNEIYVVSLFHKPPRWYQESQTEVGKIAFR